MKCRISNMANSRKIKKEVIKRLNIIENLYGSFPRFPVEVQHLFYYLPVYDLSSFEVISELSAEQQYIVSGTICELINYNNNIPYICFYDTIANTFYFLLVGFDDSDLWSTERLWLTHGKHFALAIDNERNIFTGTFDFNKKEFYDCEIFGTVLPPEEVNNEK